MLFETENLVDSMYICSAYTQASDDSHTVGSRGHPTHSQPGFKCTTRDIEGARPLIIEQGCVSLTCRSSSCKYATLPLLARCRAAAVTARTAASSVFTACTDGAQTIADLLQASGVLARQHMPIAASNEKHMRRIDKVLGSAIYNHIDQ